MALVARSTSMSETFQSDSLMFQFSLNDSSYDDWSSTALTTNSDDVMAHTSEDDEEILTSVNRLKNIDVVENSENIASDVVTREEKGGMPSVVSKSDNIADNSDTENVGLHGRVSKVIGPSKESSKSFNTEGDVIENEPTHLNDGNEHNSSTGINKTLVNVSDAKETKPLDARPKEYTNTIYADSARVGGKTKPLDVRPKEHKKATADCKYVSKKNNTKKTKGKIKNREKKLIKWRPLDLEDTGFQISLLPFVHNTHEYENKNDFAEYGHSSEMTESHAKNSQSSTVHGTSGESEEVGACGVDSVVSTSDCNESSSSDSHGRVLVSGDKNVFENDNGIDDFDDFSYFMQLGIDISDDTNLDRIENISLNKSDQTSSSETKDQKAGSTSKSAKTTELLRPKSKSKTVVTCTILKSSPKPALNTSDAVDPFCLRRLKKHDARKLYELECSSKVKIYARPDRDRKTPKVHKEIKSKNCNSVLYNPSKKDLYMHHRLYKLLGFMAHNFWPGHLTLERMPKTNLDIKAIRASQPSSYDVRRRSDRHIAPQNLNHALHESNMPGELPTDLVSFLITLQHRELTPEDYEMLLLLDDSVKPKTVKESFVDRLRTEVVESENVGQCAICMESYVTGERKKFLPCGHDFHAQCIDLWLTNSSTNCPLDGLSVETS